LILVDVNILVAAHREDAEDHREVRAWLESHLNSPAGIGVSDLLLSGCLRILTHPKIFRTPTPLPVALLYVNDLRSRPETRLFAPGPDHWKIFSHLCQKTAARGNLIPDAFHASLALELDSDWFSLDRGFARFPGLRYRHPLD
jgi:toxin-antitoxin system PIN domain toxin